MIRSDRVIIRGSCVLNILGKMGKIGEMDIYMFTAFKLLLVL